MIDTALTALDIIERIGRLADAGPVPDPVPESADDPRDVSDQFALEEPEADENRPDVEDDPLAEWVPDNAAVVLMAADDRLFILPAARLGVIVPPSRLRNVPWQQVIDNRNLGPLLGLPPVGAGATRVFKAGPRLGILVDAGRHPQRAPAATYLDHVAARMRDLGVTQLHALVLIHRHADHANEIVRVVQRFNIPASNVFVPRAYMAQQPRAEFDATLNALRAHFGSSWRPTPLVLRPASPSGELLRGRYTLGDTTLEFTALASALRHRTHTDRASLLTRVTRRGEARAMAVLGDLRGADLAQFYRAMNAVQWREFFRDVITIDGFSHHRGRLDRASVPGTMALLEATLLRTGRLTVTLQTDPGQHVQARADTLEFMRRIGIEVRETHIAATRQTSGVRASPTGARASGPAARAHQPEPSVLTMALGRIRKLAAARGTIALWGPHIAQSNPAFNTTAELRRIDSSLTQLRTAVADGIRAAAAVRTSGARTSAGGRDYSGGSHGAAFQAALARIPATTTAETAIGTEGFAELARMRRIPRAQVPLYVALRDALLNGRYSRQAFRYMLSQLDPRTRDSLLSGPRGGASGRLAAFNRVRAEFGFRQAVGGFNMIGAGHLRTSGARARARGTGGLLLGIELLNIAAQVTQTYRIAQNTARRRHVAPFLRRIAFWRQLRAEPASVAVEDNLTGQVYERDPARIDAGLQANRWDFLYIEHTSQRPALSEADILQLITVLGYNIRNYDEYGTLFEDSGQDALRWVPDRAWTSAHWEVRVGRFETSGSNHIVERWIELPLLTEGMQALTRRVLQNTIWLLERIGRGESTDTQELGTLQTPRGNVLYTARLRSGVTRSAAELHPVIPNQWSGPARQGLVRHSLNWQQDYRYTFYVWRESGSQVLVTGADFVTYSKLRELLTEHYSIGTYGRNLNALYKKIVGNETGEAWIAKADIERL